MTDRRCQFFGIMVPEGNFTFCFHDPDLACDKPARFKVDVFGGAWLCAEHYDLWCAGPDELNSNEGE